MIKGRSISAGRSAGKLLPPPMRHLVETAAERVKDRAWYFAFSASQDFKRVFETSFEGMVAPDKDEMEEAESLYRLMVGALIEKLGGPDKSCSEAHQTALYLRSARQDHQKAAALYEKKAGGRRAVQAEMDAWAAAHEEEIRELVGAYSVRTTKYAGQGPQSMPETLDFWSAKTAQDFADGHPPAHFAAGLGADGSGLLFKSDGFEGIAEKQAFDELVNHQCIEQGLDRQVRIDAAWMAKPGLDPEQAEGPEAHDEIFVVKVIEGEKMIANILRIEPAPPGGQPRLAPPERADGEDVA